MIFFCKTNKSFQQQQQQQVNIYLPFSLNTPDSDLFADLHKNCSNILYLRQHNCKLLRLRKIFVV